MLLGFCFLAFGVFWLALGLGAIGSSDGFRVWHLVFGLAYLVLGASYFVLAAVRKKRRRANERK